MALMVRKVIEAGAVLGLKPSRRAVLLVLAEHVDHKRSPTKSWPTNITVEFESGLGERTVTRSIADLCKLGLISREPQGYNRPAITHFAVDRIDEICSRFEEEKSGHRDQVLADKRSDSSTRRVDSSSDLANRSTVPERERGVTGDGSRGVTSDGSVIEGGVRNDGNGVSETTERGVTGDRLTSNELAVQLEPTNQSVSSDLQGTAADLGLVGDNRAQKVQQLCDTFLRAEPQVFNKTHRGLVTEIVQAGNDRHGFIDQVLAGLHNSANVGAVLTTRLKEVRDRMAQPSSVQPPAPIECTRPDCDNLISMILGPDGREFCPECHPSFVNARRRAAQRKAS